MAFVACSVKVTRAMLNPDAESKAEIGLEMVSPPLGSNRSPLEARLAPPPLTTVSPPPSIGTMNPAGTELRSVTLNALLTPAKFSIAMTKTTWSPASTP